MRAHSAGSRTANDLEVDLGREGWRERTAREHREAREDVEYEAYAIYIHNEYGCEGADSSLEAVGR